MAPDTQVLELVSGGGAILTGSSQESLGTNMELTPDFGFDFD